MCNLEITNQDQKKRAEAGRKLAKKIIVNGATATYAGSGKSPYHITLDSCSCGDYIRHHETCKHMFALAYNIGII